MLATRLKPTFVLGYEILQCSIKKSFKVWTPSGKGFKDRWKKFHCILIGSLLGMFRNSATSFENSTSSVELLLYFRQVLFWIQFRYVFFFLFIDEELTHEMCNIGYRTRILSKTRRNRKSVMMLKQKLIISRK